MSPKKRIKKRKPSKTKAKAKTSPRKLHKRKLKDALSSKAKAKKASRGKGKTKPKKQAPRGKASPSRAPRIQKPDQQVPISSGRPHGRPSRFNQSEEAFLANVPKQLREFVWRPGQSGNPAGRPKGIVNLTGRLRALLLTPIDKPGKGGAKKAQKERQTYGDELMALALQAARKGDYRFFQHIYERMEGKVPEHLVIEAAKEMVAKESQALAMDFLQVVVGLAEEVFGADRAQEFTTRLTSSITERFQVEDASSRAG